MSWTKKSPVEKFVLNKEEHTPSKWKALCKQFGGDVNTTTIMMVNIDSIEQWNRPEYERVVQMGFDIAVKPNGEKDLSNLWNEIDLLIGNYMSLDQTELNFSSIGIEAIEDMSHAYGKNELDLINN